MNKTTHKGQVEDWCWEIVGLRLRKTEEYGKPYTGIASVTICNDIPFVEGLLVDNLTRKDYETLIKIGKHFGFDEFEAVRKRKDVK